MTILNRFLVLVEKWLILINRIIRNWLKLKVKVIIIY
jgi:hypothetical protein